MVIDKTKIKKIILGILGRFIYLLIGYILGSFTSCSLIKHQEELTKYTKMFIEESGGVIEQKDIENISLRFGNLDYPKLGMCYYNINTIMIDKDEFFKSGSFSKKGLIFHELGHCVCKLGHNNQNRMDSYCPESLMNKYLPSEWCLAKYWKEYIGDLYFNCRRIKRGL